MSTILDEEEVGQPEGTGTGQEEGGIGKDEPSDHSTSTGEKGEGPFRASPSDQDQKKRDVNGREEERVDHQSKKSHSITNSNSSNNEDVDDAEKGKDFLLDEDDDKRSDTIDQTIHQSQPNSNNNNSNNNNIHNEPTESSPEQRSTQPHLSQPSQSSSPPSSSSAAAFAQTLKPEAYDQGNPSKANGNEPLNIINRTTNGELSILDDLSNPVDHLTDDLPEPQQRPTKRVRLDYQSGSDQTAGRKKGKGKDDDDDDDDCMIIETKHPIQPNSIPQNHQSSNYFTATNTNQTNPQNISDDSDEIQVLGHKPGPIPKSHELPYRHSSSLDQLRNERPLQSSPTAVSNPRSSIGPHPNSISIDLTEDSDQEPGLMGPSSVTSSSSSSSSILFHSPPAPQTQTSRQVGRLEKPHLSSSNQLLRQNVARRQAEQLQLHNQKSSSPHLQYGQPSSSADSRPFSFNIPVSSSGFPLPSSSFPSTSRVHQPPPHPGSIYQTHPSRFPSHSPAYSSQSTWRNSLEHLASTGHSSYSGYHFPSPAHFPQNPDQVPVCIGLLSSLVMILYHFKGSEETIYGPDGRPKPQTFPALITRDRPRASQEVLKVMSSAGEPIGLVQNKTANAIGSLLGPINSISGIAPVGGWKPDLSSNNRFCVIEEEEEDDEIAEIDGRTGNKIPNGSAPQPNNDERLLYIECCVINNTTEKNPLMLPLQILAFCLPMKVPIVASYLTRNGMVLEHPMSYDPNLHLGCRYGNPHSPPPRDRADNIRQRLMGIGGSSSLELSEINPPHPGHSQTKTYDVHEQIDTVFKNLASGVDLDETEPSELVTTPLYPHQKQALSFMLDREKLKNVEEEEEQLRKRRPVLSTVELNKLELQDEENLVSLWRKQRDSRGKHIGWVNVVTGTHQNCTQSPEQCRGSLLADDMGLGKTISVISLIATTLREALEFSHGEIVKPSVVTQTTVKNNLNPNSSIAADSTSTLLERLGHATGDSSSASKAKLKKDDQTTAKKQSAVDARFKMVKVKSRATLIVSPVSTIQNWESQLEEHVRRRTNDGKDSKDPAEIGSSHSALSVYVYHGNHRNPDPEFLADHDVVITTYSLLGYEFARQNRGATKEEENHNDSSDGIEELDATGNPISGNSAQDRSNKAQPKKKRKGDGLPSPLQAIQWFRIVLDEAHMIKEHTTIQSKAACDLLAERRVCLTGTPLQNSLNDLFSLVCFLRLEPFTDRSLWTSYVGAPAKIGNKLGISRLHLIMRHLALRRTKQTVDKNGKPILNLPHKKDDIVQLNFNESEKEFYLAYHQRSRKTFLTMEKEKSVLSNYCSILQEILRLRQICVHVGLVVDAEKKAGNSAYDMLGLSDLHKDFGKTRAIQLLMILRETGATQCCDCGGDVVPASTEDGLEEDEDWGSSAPKRSRKTNGAKKKNKGLGPSTLNEESESASSSKIVITKCQHLFCFQCFRITSEMKGEIDCPVCFQKLNPLVDVYQTTVMELEKDIRSTEIEGRRRIENGEGNECEYPKNILKKLNPSTRPDPNPSSTSTNEKSKETRTVDMEHSTKIKHLIWDLMPFSRANPSSVNYSTLDFMLDDGLDDDEDKEPPEFRPVRGKVVKSVVFSQWTKLLDKISVALTEYKIEHVRLDGTMSRDERVDSMNAFKIDPKFEVLLVSLRAGGVGLNLTCAQRVYLMEPFWNPAVENQAVDRVHRLGQTKPVRMIRYIISGSIEQNMLEIQKRKTDLANMSLGQTLSKAELAKRRLEDLTILFRDNMKR